MNAVIILPTYNERPNIGVILEKLHSVVKQIPGHRFTFLVVDDTSPDDTASVVRGLQKKYTDISIITGKKEGLGKALLRGLTYAIERLKADILIQIDADLSHDPSVLPRFLEALDTGADFVVGSRYIPGGSIPDNWGLHRKIYSVVGNAIVRFGLGFSSVHDWTGGYRALRKTFFDSAKDELREYSGYVFQIAFLHKAIKHGAKIVEVPIHFTDRRFGHSKIAPSEYIRNVIVYIVKERLKSSFGKFLVVGTVGFILNTLVLEIFVLLGFHPTIGSAVGAECAIISNFFLNNHWTFQHRRIGKNQVVSKFIQFNGTSLGALFIQSGIVAAGTFTMGVAAYRQFYIFGIVLGLLWNYFMYSRVIWKE
ncbi:glycosyltransferase family 2 protein [Candidatus Gottesmanbacteria bacterium]|nr:glycosyltransferase family 2 protein [Candidatus Gottesmanbacteria bacterium]